MWNLISVCLGGENILALQKNNNNSKTYFHLEIAPLFNALIFNSKNKESSDCSN